MIDIVLPEDTVEQIDNLESSRLNEDTLSSNELFYKIVNVLII